MARPYKARRVCCRPAVDVFGPLNQEWRNQVELTLEEYESIRLIDLLECTQEECAGQMGVARTTIQAVYNSARKKLADCLVNGKRLEIRGGNYRLCPKAQDCCHRECRKRRCRRQCCDEQKENQMKIAVTYEKEEIFQHFGHCETFKIYETENGLILSSRVADTEGNGHGALALFLKGLGVDTLICGGIGEGARTALDAAGIKLYPGASGNADEAVKALLEGKLAYDPETRCSHHHEGGEHHGCHGHGGTCGH